MSLVYVFAASRMEGRPVEQIGGGGPPGGPSVSGGPARLGANEFVLITGGMGPKGAGAKARDALRLATNRNDKKPPSGKEADAVLVIGLCGGLTSSLPESRIVAYTDCLSTEPSKPPLRCSPSITNRLRVLLVSRGILCDPVVAITSPRIAVTKNDKMTLARSGANVVDMESYEILAASAQAGVPAAIVRVVSDSLDRKMPDFNRALNEDGALDGRKAVRVALTAPIQTARLLAANRRAMHHLSKALGIILPADCFIEIKSE